MDQGGGKILGEVEGLFKDTESIVIAAFQVVNWLAD
jgi:hypothetical protein